MSVKVLLSAPPPPNHIYIFNNLPTCQTVYNLHSTRTGTVCSVCEQSVGQ